MKKITLKDILRDKRQEVEQKKSKEPIGIFKKKIASCLPVRDFTGRISGEKLMAIAEIKKKSPSAGLITGLSAVRIAREYEASSYCCAISVLTDKKYFGGDVKLLKKIKSVTTRPVLRKDFIIDEYQIYESRAYGADMILLIAGILSKEELKRFFGIARHLGLACLIESHSPEDIKKIPPEANIYGINTRALAGDFSTDLNTAKKLIKYIPEKKIIVVESGIATKNDIEFVKSLKQINAVLIGTSILRKPHPGQALDKLFR
jgi:indole-3-glycerol phosphate synthase